MTFDERDGVKKLKIKNENCDLFLNDDDKIIFYII